MTQNAQRRHLGVLAASQVAVIQVIESGRRSDAPEILSKTSIQKALQVTVVRETKTSNSMPFHLFLPLFFSTQNVSHYGDLARRARSSLIRDVKLIGVLLTVVPSSLPFPLRARPLHALGRAFPLRRDSGRPVRELFKRPLGLFHYALFQLRSSLALFFDYTR